MAANKTTPISNASSYREIGEYWDDHDLSDHPTHEVQFEVDIRSSAVYFAVEKTLAEKLRAVANDQGLSPENLLNRWVEEQVTNARLSK